MSPSPRGRTLWLAALATAALPLALGWGLAGTAAPQPVGQHAPARPTPHSTATATW
ncbi:hypothetical protein ACFV2Q_29980 [Streptomyces sp. NPDC059650]|uniref:hypothetical protein n=1 Tax=Streptomyces sp. NPDC059650 TaxID=3346896 RepID=UPI0036B6CE56